MRRTYQFSKRLRALPKFWRTLKQMDMERTECVPKDDFGPAESDPAGGVFGNTFGSLTYSVFKYKHQNFYLVQTSFSEFVQ